MTELSEKLLARGFGVAALHGDIAQAMRKKVIDRLKGGELDIVIATDVAARGIDVNRMSHVINYDIPFDTESYIHRIGRTGRAGRKGKAILFVTPREQRLLRNIEIAINKPIKQIDPPSLAEINIVRGKQLTEKVVNAIKTNRKLAPYQAMVEAMMAETGYSEMEIATGLVCLTQQAYGIPVEMSSVEREPERRSYRSDRSGSARGRPDRPSREGSERYSRSDRFDKPRSERSNSDRPDRARSDRSDRSDRPVRARSESSDRPVRARSESSDRPPRARAEQSDRPARARSDRGADRGAISRPARAGKSVSTDRPEHAKKKKKYGAGNKAGAAKPKSETRKKLSLKE